VRKKKEKERKYESPQKKMVMKRTRRVKKRIGATIPEPLRAMEVR